MTSYSTCCELIEGLKQFSHIRYVAYRTAAKVKFLQDETHLGRVRLQHIFQELEKLGFGSGDVDLLLNRSEMLRIMGGIFHQAQRILLIDLDKTMACNLVVDLVEATFCRQNKGLTLLDFIVFLTVLCGGLDISEKYKKLLHFVCDDSNMVCRNALKHVLKPIGQIAHLVHEASAFGQWTVYNAVEQCFSKFEGGLNEIPLNAALEWLMFGPQSLVWWSTLSRLNASSKVIHSVRCSVCNVPQIQGLRYQCLKCLCYNQCQQCFWSGFISKNHKIHHQMQEYCSKTTSKEATRALWKKMSNWLTLNKKSMRSSAQYLPFENAEKICELASSNEHLNSLSEMTSEAINMFSDVRNGSDHEHVGNVVRDLIDEKARLENILRNAHSTNSLYPIVEEHCKQLELQLRRLCKNQKQSAQQRTKKTLPHLPKFLTRLESTPLLPKGGRNASLEPLNFSPIDEPHSVILRAQSQRLSLRMPGKAGVTNPVSSSYCTPRMMKRPISKSSIDSYLNEPPRFMTDFTLKDLSRELQQTNNTAMVPLTGDTSDSKLNEELEAILAQLDQLFPVSSKANPCDTFTPILGTNDTHNITLVKASNHVAGALAEFLDGFKE